MKYVKPDVYVERFKANAYFSNCDPTKYNKPVTAQCIITQSEVVYNENTFYEEGNPQKCSYYASGLVSFSGGYFRSQMDVIEAFKDGKVTSDEYSESKGEGYNYELAAGNYLVWTGGGQTHVGPVSEEFYDVLTENS